MDSQAQLTQDGRVLTLGYPVNEPDGTGVLGDWKQWVPLFQMPLQNAFKRRKEADKKDSF